MNPNLKLPSFLAARVLSCIALAAGLGVAPAQSQPAARPAKAPPASSAPLSGPGSLAGIWANSDYDRDRVFDPNQQILKTSDGKMPPLRPAAAAVLQKRIDAAKNGDVFVTPLSQCLPSGVPAMMFYPGLPIQFLETPQKFYMLNEQLTNFRIIYMNAKHEKDPDPSYFGDSVAHWEDGALVVDTIGLTTKTTIDQPGMPHSEDLHVVERYRRLDKNTIELRVTFDDPKTFTAPWVAVTHFKSAPPDRRIEEYVCENQRNQTVNGAVGVQKPGTAK